MAMSSEEGEQATTGSDYLTDPQVDRVSGGQLYSNTQFGTLVSEGWMFVSQYGWFLLLGAVLLVWLWYKMRPHYSSWRRERERQQEERNFDPVREERYQEAMLRARERMQRAQDTNATEYMNRKEEREAVERDERIKQWEQFKVVTRSKTRPKTDSSGYMPLSGHGGGGGYRAARRTVGGGGG